MNKAKTCGLIGLIVLLLIVFCLPYERETGAFSQILYAWGERQEESSDKIIDKAVSGVEDDLVGEHQIKGANWSIPNIIRHLLGVDDTT